MTPRRVLESGTARVQRLSASAIIRTIFPRAAGAGPFRRSREPTAWSRHQALCGGWRDLRSATGGRYRWRGQRDPEHGHSPLIAGRVPFCAHGHRTRANLHLGIASPFVAGALNAGGFLAISNTRRILRYRRAFHRRQTIWLARCRAYDRGILSLCAFLVGAMTTALMVNFGKGAVRPDSANRTPRRCCWKQRCCYCSAGGRNTQNCTSSSVCH